MRNNLPAPDESIVVNPDDWRFEVVGARRSGSMTLAELKALPVRMEAAVLQCSGSGRACFGVNNVKWVKRIALTEEETGASIQASGYRFRDIGESGSSKQPSMYRMPVKSWVNGPGADGVSSLIPGQNTLHGVAFSGERGIEKVEVSADGGKSWREAQLVGYRSAHQLRAADGQRLDCRFFIVACY